eukprot:15778098-Heterocapsa_arctica.AAC.1
MPAEHTHARQPVGRRAARQRVKEQRTAQFTIKVFEPREPCRKMALQAAQLPRGSKPTSSSSSTSMPASSCRWACATEAHA